MIRKPFATSAPASRPPSSRCWSPKPSAPPNGWASRCVTASGGVTCNGALRRELTRACAARGYTLRLAERSLCTDNAAMIGILAERKLLARVPPSSLDAEIEPAPAEPIRSIRRQGPLH
jgi:tRNA A37 threonylcarbamoyltransferase TsaD